MAGLVIGRGPLLLLGQDHALTFDAHQDLVLGELKVLQLDGGLVESRRQERRFIDEVLEICPRSEEHTSELQSLAYLVCRLLLEKKKKMQRYRPRLPALNSC